MNTIIFTNTFLLLTKVNSLPTNLQWILQTSSLLKGGFWYIGILCLVWIPIMLWWHYRKVVFTPGALLLPDCILNKPLEVAEPIFLHSSAESGKDPIAQPIAVSKLYQELEMANQDIEIFLYKAYHNFLGPIATIRGVCNVAVLDGQEEHSKQYFTQVNHVAESMLTMLEKLLEISGIHNHRTSLAQINLNGFIRNYQDSQANHSESVQARFQLNTPSTFQVYTDSFLLTTALEKIITNAYRFSREKPHRVVDVFVKHQETTDYDIIRLKQYGLLLPTETLDNLFKMFYRSSDKPDDHGLGFYAARYALRRMGGDIAIESGAGYITFCLRLPKVHSHLQVNGNNDSE